MITSPAFKTTLYYYIPYLYSTFFIHWNTFKSALLFGHKKEWYTC